MRSHQTIRLTRGKHRSPASGACVMELASLLGEERFSDHPDCVCPVLAEFLRTYNDQVGDRLRQDLYELASSSVGTSRGRVAQTARAEMCLRWWQANDPYGPRLHAVLWALGLNTLTRRRMIAEGAARWAARSPALHAQAMQLAADMTAVFSQSAGVDAPIPGTRKSGLPENEGVRHGYESPQTSPAPAGLGFSRP